MFRGPATRDVVQRLFQNKTLWSRCASETFAVAPLLCEPAFCLPGSSHGHCTQIHF